MHRKNATCIRNFAAAAAAAFASAAFAATAVIAAPADGQLGEHARKAEMKAKDQLGTSAAAAARAGAGAGDLGERAPRKEKIAGDVFGDQAYARATGVTPGKPIAKRRAADELGESRPENDPAFTLLEIRIAQADLDASGFVDFGDLMLVIADFGYDEAFVEEPDPWAADVDLDGRVDMTDLVYVLNHYGAPTTIGG